MLKNIKCNVQPLLEGIFWGRIFKFWGGISKFFFWGGELPPLSGLYVTLYVSKARVRSMPPVIHLT